MKLAELLETRRTGLKLTPDEAARRLGISRRQWDRLTKGETKVTRPRLTLRLKSEFGLSLDDIYATDGFKTLETAAP